MPERRPTPQVVALILNLRRSAEREARRRFHGAKAELELARGQAARTAQWVLAAERGLLAVLSGRVMKTGRQTASALFGACESLRRHREELTAARAEAAEGGKRLALKVRQAEGLRELWMLSISRREAAERHEQNERRDRLRFRARRAAALEDEMARRSR